jgi:hypothetical protein
MMEKLPLPHLPTQFYSTYYLANLSYSICTCPSIQDHFLFRCLKRKFRNDWLAGKKPDGGSKNGRGGGLYSLLKLSQERSEQ